MIKEPQANPPIVSLLPPFYERPIYDDPRVFLQRIVSEFAIHIERYAYLMDAFDHDVFVINDAFVFRFPRTARDVEHLPQEIRFLRFLQDKVSVRIPHYEWISPRGDLAGYRIVPGQVLAPWIFQRLRETDRMAAVDQLVGFINVLHGLDLTQFSHYQPRTRPDFVAIERQIRQELERRLLPELSTEEVAAIDGLYHEANRYFATITNSCPTHGDLYAFNVIWDHSSSQIGVIDFSDLLIGDPAKDFEVFFDYGAEYASHAYARYTGPHDASFLRRAELYYKIHAIYTLLSSKLDARITFEHARKRFRQKFGLPPIQTE
jgi:aminoglycoside 2''-phosphotransferase